MSTRTFISLGAASAGAIFGWAACSGSDSGITTSSGSTGTMTTVGSGGTMTTTTSTTDTSTTSTTTNGSGGAAGSGPTGTGGAATTTMATGGRGGAGGGTGGAGGSGMGGQPNAGANVLQFHNNLSRDGLYIDAAFTKAKAMTIHKDMAFSATIQGATLAQPLYFEGAAGGKNIVITATMRNEVSALDATTGAVVWRKTIGTAPAGGGAGGFGCGNMQTIGITGTPVIDAASKTIFFDAAETGPIRKIHALSLDDGSEKAGWPVDVVANVKSGALTFNPTIQSQRASPTIVNGVLYVPYGGIIGDCGNYRGWVAGIPITAPTQVKAYATAAVKSGIWGPGGIASDGTDLFVTTGNAPSGTAFGQQESIVRLQAGPVFNGTGNANFFTPPNWQQLDNGDTDLGGSGPILVDVPNATPSKLVVALGKDGNIYLADRSNLGGIGAGVSNTHVASNQIIQAGASYTTAAGTYVVFKGTGAGCPMGQNGDLTAVKISAAAPPRATVAWCAQQGGLGSPMVTTTDGHSEALVWSLGGTSLRGFDGDTGAVVFNGGGTNVGAVSQFVSPIAARGHIYVASDSAVSSFVMP